MAHALPILVAALFLAQAPNPLPPAPDQPAPNPPAQEPPVQEPPAQEPPAQEPPAQEPPAPDADDPIPEIQTPNTPLGRHLAWVMRVINLEEAPGDLADHFSPRFLELYKPAKVTKELTTIRRDAFANNRIFITRLTENDTSITATIVGEGSRRALSCLIVIDDATGKIASLYFDRAEYGWGNNAPGNWDELEGNAGDMKGEASFGAYELILVPTKPEDNAAGAAGAARKDTLSGPGYALFPLHEFGLDNRLAIAGLGSLFIMPPLADRIADGTLTWDHAVSRDAALCILPGSVFDAPADAPAPAPHPAPHPAPQPAELPLRVLMGALLNPADASAADHAITLLSRDAIEKDLATYVADPLLLTPFLYRFEMLRVRNMIDPDNANPWDQLPGQYLRADPDQRRSILADQVRFLHLTSEEAQLLAKRHRGDIDPFPAEHFCSWYATPRDLANAIARVQVHAHVDAMAPLRDAIAARAASTAAHLQGTPAAADPKVWNWECRSIAQEPGVIAAASILHRRDNRTFLLIAIQNHAQRGITMDRMNDLLAKGRDIVGEYKFEPEKAEAPE